MKSWSHAMVGGDVYTVCTGPRTIRVVRPSGVWPHRGVTPVEWLLAYVGVGRARGMY